MEFFNSLNLKQIKGGTKLKQGDLGSVLSYSLTDENGQEITSFDNKTAYINLVLDDKIWFTTTTLVDISRVTFRIDKPIPIGLYYLEIKIDDYIFPSDRDSIILIEEGSTPYDLKELVPNYDINMTIKGILSDLSQKGIDISDLKTKMNAIYNNALADHVEVAQARANYDTLGNRLNDMTTRIGGIAEGSPKGVYPNLAALQAAKPNGDSGIYITADNGHWYYYNNGWKDGGVYQATGASPESISSFGKLFYNQESAGEYADLNNLPANRIFAYSHVTMANAPLDYKSSDAWVFTSSYSKNNPIQFQIFATITGKIFVRSFWSYNFTEWVLCNDSSAVKPFGKLFHNQETAGEYADLNNLPANRIFAFTSVALTNAPKGVVDAFVQTLSYQDGSKTMLQILTDVLSGKTYKRAYWDGKWQPWRNQENQEGYETVVVDKEGKGDFSKVADAFQFARNNPGTEIIINGGTYDYFEECGGEDYLKTLEASNPKVEQFWMKDVKIIGKGNVTINYLPAKNIADKYPKSMTVISVIDVCGNCHVENLTINVNHCRYAIHDESAGLAENYNTVHVYKNVKATYGNERSGTIGGQAFACGYDNGQKFEFENCHFKSSMTEAMSFHNRKSYGGTITINNCILDSDNSYQRSLRFGNVGRQQDTNVYINNSIITQKLAIQEESGMTGSTNCFNIYAIGCNNFELFYDTARLGENTKDFVRY